MKSENQEHSPHHHHTRHHHNQTRLVSLFQKILKSSKSRYIIFLILGYIIGYVLHSQPLISSRDASHSPSFTISKSTNNSKHSISEATNNSKPIISKATNNSSKPVICQPSADLAAHHYFPSKCSNPVSSDQIRDIIIHKAFNGSSPWANFPPPHVSNLLHKEWSKGWGSQAAVFEHLINQVKPKTIIEVGTFLGASATHMFRLTQKLMLDSQIICIDDFRGWPGYYDEEKSLEMVNGDSMLMYQFMKNVVNANATNSIIFLPFSASTALGGLCDWGVYGDLVEIDAAHDFHSAWIDINNAYKVLKKPGGLMFGHDIVWPGVKKAVHIFARLHKFRVKIDGEHWILY